MIIAIMLSTYNGEKYIKKQLDSLVNQSYKAYMKVFVRDDGSTDNTLSILEEYIEKINLTIIKGENVGPGKSFWELFMNQNINADYYAFCDQDDIWDSDKIEKGVLALKNEEKPALWCSNCRIINAHDEVISNVMNIKKPDFSLVSQIICGTTQGCAMLFNNELKVRIFNNRITDFPMHDFVLITFAIAIGIIIYDPIPTFSYRVHSANVVANTGKNFLTHYRDSLKYWFSNEHKRELSRYVKRFFEINEEYLDKDTRNYIKNFIDSSIEIDKRLVVILDKRTKSDNHKAERSFKIRTIIGII